MTDQTIDTQTQPIVDTTSTQDDTEEETVISDMIQTARERGFGEKLMDFIITIFDFISSKISSSKPKNKKNKNKKDKSKSKNTKPKV